MIELLDHKSKSVANEIYDVFQSSYKIEAKLVGVADFPPLRRTAQQIQSSDSEFLGRRAEEVLAAVAEITSGGEELTIDSLVVHPKYFRRGLASCLLSSLLDKNRWRAVYVETAAANRPAIELYQKLGFSELKRWKTVDGIDKVQLMCVNKE